MTQICECQSRNLPHCLCLQVDTRVNWLGHKIEGSLQEVPGIGPKAEEKLVAAGITTTFQLMGKFCMGKADDVADSQQLCNAFFRWLAEVGINSHRASITLLVAEKCGAAFP